MGWAASNSSPAPVKSHSLLPALMGRRGAWGGRVLQLWPLPTQNSFCPSFFPEGDKGQEKLRASAPSPRS